MRGRIGAKVQTDTGAVIDLRDTFLSEAGLGRCVRYSVRRKGDERTSSECSARGSGQAEHCC